MTAEETVSCTVVVFAAAPANVARTVIVEVAAVAPAPTTSVMVLVVEAAGIGDGAKDAVTFAGNPSAASTTSPAAPPDRVTVIGTVALVP